MVKYTPVFKLPRVENEIVTMDVEADGLHYMMNKPKVLGLKIRGKSYMVKWNGSLAGWLEENMPMIKASVFHNAKFDLHMFIQGGVTANVVHHSQIHCTMVGEAILDEHQYEYDLDTLGRKHFKMFKISLPEGLKVNQLWEQKPDIVAPYLFRDLEITEALYLRQNPKIHEEELQAIMRLEMDVLRALIDMERRGIPVDMDKLEWAKDQLDHQLNVITERINKAVGFELNTMSRPQMMKAFEVMGIGIPINDEGNPTFDKTVLKILPYDFCQDILASRSMRKGTDLFIAAIENYSIDGKVYTNFHQLRGEGGGVMTGRLSSSGPNMQQAPNPKRSPELSKIIRVLFNTGKNKHKKWIRGDWEQFEFRIFAHYSGEESVIRAYKSDPATDFHQIISEMTGVARDPFAKQINLGLIFGMGEGKLAQQLGLPYTKETNSKGKVYLKPGPEAMEIFKMYHNKFPGAKKVLQRASNLASQRGYVKTIFGRKIRFPNKHSTYKAGGLVFQGTAADIMKAKLVELNRSLQEGGGSLILSIHDEFDAIAETGCEGWVITTMKEVMEDVPWLKVPILADVKAGPNWYEASK